MSMKRIPVWIFTSYQCDSSLASSTARENVKKIAEQHIEAQKQVNHYKSIPVNAEEK